MNPQTIRTIFINVANGVNNHGDFLKRFGMAVASADEFNLKLLMPSAELLVKKYNLNRPEYLKED